MSEAPNDGRFPDESEVLVRYPAPEMTFKANRDDWPWYPGVIDHQCGPDEWLVTVYAREVAMLEDDSPAPDGTPEEDMWHPQCFRDASEIRRAVSLTCVSDEAARVVARNADRSLDPDHMARQDGSRVIIAYSDKRFPYDVAGWAFQNGHASDAEAAATIARL